MTLDEAELKKAIVEDMAQSELHGYKIDRVEIEDMVPGEDEWVTVVYFAGYADPCVMGDELGVATWLARAGKVLSI